MAMNMMNGCILLCITLLLFLAGVDTNSYNPQGNQQNTETQWKTETQQNTETQWKTETQQKTETQRWRDREVEVQGQYRKDGTCGHPDNLANSQSNVTQSWSPSGTIATYTCDPGFYLLGNNFRRCEANGSWSGVAPLCARKVSVGKSINCTASEFVDPNQLIFLVDGKDETCARVLINTNMYTKNDVTLIWRMDLFEQYTAIRSFRLVFQGNMLLDKVYLESNTKHELTPSNCEMSQRGLQANLKEIIITPKQPQAARFVTFHLKLLNLNDFHEFCEAEVYDTKAPAVHQCFTQDKMDDSGITKSYLKTTAVYGQTCYTFDKENNGPWIMANQLCRDVNDGSVISNINRELNRVIVNFAKASVIYSSYWMGGRTEKKFAPEKSQEQSLVWKWENGEQVDQSLFTDNDAKENECLTFNGATGAWLKLLCTQFNGIICQTGVKRCSSPQLEVHVIAINPYNFSVGAAIDYRCPTGLTMVGDQRRVCMPNGQWSGEVPKCLGENDHAAYQADKAKLPNEAILGIIIAAVIVGLVLLGVMAAIIVSKKRGGRFKKKIHFHKENMKDGESVETLDDAADAKCDTARLSQSKQEDYKSITNEANTAEPQQQQTESS